MNETGGKQTQMFDRLVATLEDAVELVGSFAGNAQFRRLVEAFRLMPLEDRGPIIGAIEREVRARHLTRATEEATGHSMHPNPRARLYVRAHETPALRRHTDRDDLMLSMLRCMRTARFLLVPEVHAAWRDGTREALDHLEPAEREGLLQLTRELLALTEASSRVAAPAELAARTG